MQVIKIYLSGTSILALGVLAATLERELWLVTKFLLSEREKIKNKVSVPQGRKGFPNT